MVDVEAMRSAVTPQQISTEETKIRQVEESIRVFVRVADPKFRQVVPMRFFNLSLTASEAEACSADFLEEKKPPGPGCPNAPAHCGGRGPHNHRAGRNQAGKNSPSLWKLHADSLVTLMEVAAALSESTSRVVKEAAESGQNSAGEAIKVSLQRLRQRCDLVTNSLAQAQSV